MNIDFEGLLELANSVAVVERKELEALKSVASSANAFVYNFLTLHDGYINAETKTLLDDLMGPLAELSEIKQK